MSVTGEGGVGEWYAHSKEGAPVEEWHRLEDHLKGTARRAEEFAGVFSPGWGRLAGLWHDAGKYRQAFQEMIRKDADAPVKVDHSSVGAVLAAERRAQPLALAIAGHHGGLADREEVRGRLGQKQGLLGEAGRQGLPAWLEQAAVPAAPGWVGSDTRKLALWVRMVFSALVDADFLDTERFHEGVERELRRAELGVLLERLERHIAQKEAEAPATPVNAMRARIRRACRQAAKQGPGVFTLTVPTGGGKTLSSLEFALRHAVEHQLRRVIVVIRFTSITEQRVSRGGRPRRASSGRRGGRVSRGGGGDRRGGLGVSRGGRRGGRGFRAEGARDGRAPGAGGGESRGKRTGRKTGVLRG